MIRWEMSSHRGLWSLIESTEHIWEELFLSQCNLIAVNERSFPVWFFIPLVGDGIIWSSEIRSVWVLRVKRRFLIRSFVVADGLCFDCLLAFHTPTQTLFLPSAHCRRETEQTGNAVRMRASGYVYKTMM